MGNRSPSISLRDCRSIASPVTDVKVSLPALERVGNIVLFGEVGFLLLKIELAVSCLIDAGLLVLFQRAQQGLFVELADLFGDIVRNAGAGALLEGSVVVLTGQSGFLAVL